MLAKVNEKWYYAADLVYNKDRMKKRFEMAKSFLNVSIYCFENELWGPFGDNLFSTTELSIQCILLMLHYGRYSVKQSHDETLSLFAEFARNGNVEAKFSHHYQELTELRKKGRYLESLHGHDFTINQSKSKELFDSTNNLVQFVEQLLASVDLAKKPPAGEYIGFGKNTSL